MIGMEKSEEAFGSSIFKPSKDNALLGQRIRVDSSGDSKAIMVSRKCNNKCLMCHSNTNYKDDYSKQEIFSAVCQNINGSEREIQISGGEPTIRYDLIDILRKIKVQNNSARIMINTNGRMFSYQKYTNKLSKYFDSVLTEIHGPSAEIHDAITQVKGSFNQTVQGIKNLIAEDKEVAVVVLINKINYTHLQEIAEFIKENFSKVSVMFEYTWFVNNAFDNKDNLFVRVSEVPKFLEPALDVLGENAIFMHFPLCIFKRQYHHFVLQQAFVIDNRESHPIHGCSSCKLRDKCSGIWGNYSNFVDTLDEFSPYFELEDNYDDCPDYLFSEFIALNIGLKKVVRPFPKNIDFLEFNKLKAICDKYDIHVLVSDFSIDESNFKCDLSKPVDIHKDHFFVYLSKSYEDAKTAKEFEVKNYDFKLGQIFSFPDCCINSFISLDDYIGRTNRFDFRSYELVKAISKKTVSKPSFLLNYLHWDNYFLISHFPCSFNCEESILYASKLFDEIKRINPSKAKYLESKLKAPCLIIREPDMGFLITFEGVVIDGDKISYSSFHFNLRKNDYNEFFTNLHEKLTLGNLVIVNSEGFKVYFNSNEIYGYINKNPDDSFILDFS